MKKNYLTATIILWVLSFILVSFCHSFIFHFHLSETPGFDAKLPGIIGISLILTFVSISITFLLFIWMIYLIRKAEKSTTNWIRINVIPLILSVTASYFINKATVSWTESIIYAGSYLLAFLTVINFYFLRLKRAETEMLNPEILGQTDE